jgi:hypothetical protein
LVALSGGLDGAWADVARAPAGDNMGPNKSGGNSKNNEGKKNGDSKNDQKERDKDKDKDRGDHGACDKNLSNR